MPLLNFKEIVKKCQNRCFEKTKFKKNLCACSQKTGLRAALGKIRGAMRTAGNKIISKKRRISSVKAKHWFLLSCQGASVSKITLGIDLTVSNKTLGAILSHLCIA